MENQENKKVIKTEEETRQTMIKIENVKKVYRLGMIGGTTLKDELARLIAKIRKKEDPTKRIGAKNYNKGEKFCALNGVSFEVKQGEAIGLIGHNGAGKSTLLKLITRVTAPTEGKIYLNGRVASMLEVGTGFHGELTGRENIYMNGAILGMTKKEIDSKIEDIIDFSEVREFIDTPVKRYSSGMFVKLAFSVAAHLSAEILLMDEVLAVGDMAFQKKCIDKMKEVAASGRTIIYVSHNMNTIRALCNRCVVLNKGEVEFVGNVDEGISIYLDKSNRGDLTDITYLKDEHSKHRVDVLFEIQRIKILDKVMPIFSNAEQLCFECYCFSHQDLENIQTRITFYNKNEEAIGSSFSNLFNIKKGDNKFTIKFSLDTIFAGEYNLGFTLFQPQKSGNLVMLDSIKNAMSIKVTQKIKDGEYNFFTHWGKVKLPDNYVGINDDK